MCGSHLSGVTKQRRSMSTELLALVQEQVLPGAIDLSLTVAGEPFMTPKLGRFVQVAEDRDLWLQLNSNATLLRDSGLLRRVLRQSAAVRFSVDGATAQTYAAIRGSDAFAKVCDNIGLAVQIRAELPAGRRPRLAICMVLMQRNVAELSDMVTLAHDLGVDQLEVAYLTVLTPEMDAESLRHTPDRADRALLAARDRADALGFRVVLPPTMSGAPVRQRRRVRARLAVRDLQRLRGDQLVRQARSLGRKARLAVWSARAGGVVPCHFLQSGAFVTLSGDVAPCPMPGRPVAGNLHDTSFADIWNGPVLTRMRQGFLRGTPEPCCAHCSQNPARYDPADEDTARPPGGLRAVGVQG